MARRAGLSGPVVGRIAGIELRLHPTFLVLVGFALLGGLGPPVRAVVWLALVFGSVVFHELAHSITARQRGVGVRDIVLLPIGGMSELDRMPKRANDESAIAAAGPVASYVLGATAAALAAATGTSLFPVDLEDGAVLHQLAWLNVALGTFNLLPALPMDGGRLLRAWLTARLPRDTATLRAVGVSRILAYALIAAGVLVDLWLVLIGVFVLVTGGAEAAVAQVHERLAGLRVGDVMRRGPVPSGTVPQVADDAPRLHPQDRLDEAFDELVEAGTALVENEAGQVVGVLELADVRTILQQRAA